ncbi:MAG: HNH endonuclease [Thermodesulfobacteriota bacterium]
MLHLAELKRVHMVRKMNLKPDHIIPWRKGGKTIQSNCQMLCEKDNRTKSDK